MNKIIIELFYLGQAESIVSFLKNLEIKKKKRSKS